MSAWLGAGFGLRLPHLRELDERRRAGLSLPPVLELIPSHLFGRPELVDALGREHAIVLHDVFASPATAGPLDRAHLERVAALARRCGAVDYSEHLAMTRSPGGVDLGHLVAVPRTRAQLALLVEHLRAAGELLGLPVAVELPATTLELPGAELGEGELVSALVEQSGCGLHLDLENLRVDAHNGLPAGLENGPTAGPTPEPGSLRARLDEALVGAGLPSPHARAIAHRLAELPLAAVTRLHLAGGHVDPTGWAVDSHRAPVPDETWALFAGLRGFVRPRAIIIERDGRLPPLAELVEQAERAAALWRGDCYSGPGPSCFT